jgi:hypothetical protein
MAATARLSPLRSTGRKILSPAQIMLKDLSCCGMTSAPREFPYQPEKSSESIGRERLLASRTSHRARFLTNWTLWNDRPRHRNAIKLIGSGLTRLGALVRWIVHGSWNNPARSELQIRSSPFYTRFFLKRAIKLLTASMFTEGSRRNFRSPTLDNFWFSETRKKLRLTTTSLLFRLFGADPNRDQLVKTSICCGFASSDFGNTTFRTPSW